MTDTKSCHRPAGLATPRLIIHGGAGNITRRNLSREAWLAYRSALLQTLRSTQTLLAGGSSAIDAAVHAVSLLEDHPLFNAGRGAVFTRAGTTELEASIMVSRGKRKRGGSVMLLRHVKNPILLAREILRRGDADDGKGGGAYGHLQLSGAPAETLAHDWGLDMVPEEYFWTEKRWQEHRRGLERERKNDEGQLSLGQLDDEEEYLPQGTVGAVAMDQWGTLCVATSTGGMTNKLPGRIGDTPTFGAGFWAEEWEEELEKENEGARTVSSSSLASWPAMHYYYNHPTNLLTRPLIQIARAFIGDCISSPAPSSSRPIPPSAAAAAATMPISDEKPPPNQKKMVTHRAIALSGTGNGDSFLRLCACRLVSAMARYSPLPLHAALTRVAGANGDLQRSAGPRWPTTGEGQGGIIGIEVVSRSDGTITGTPVADFNCGGMFRAWLDDCGMERCLVFRGEEY